MIRTTNRYVVALKLLLRYEEPRHCVQARLIFELWAQPTRDFVKQRPYSPVTSLIILLRE